MSTEEKRVPGQEENPGNNQSQEFTASAVQDGNEVMSVTVKEDGTITTAISEPEMAGDGEKENVADSFKGLPMRDLIASPLIAACEAQLMLSQTAFQYMKEIGFTDAEATKTRMLKFTLDRPVETPDGITTSQVEVQAPFLGLVPIPSLLIEHMNVNFQMEVTASSQTKTTNKAETSMNASTNFKFGLFGGAKIDIQGKVSTSRENTRSTNQTAKYQVDVTARQQPPTEGLSKLMDIMASCTAPLSVK